MPRPQECETGSQPDGAERSVTEVVSKKTGFSPTDVSCPSGVDAKVGGTFDCTFTGPGNTDYTAHMTIQKVEGEQVLFNVSAEPTK